MMQHNREEEELLTCAHAHTCMRESEGDQNLGERERERERERAHVKESFLGKISCTKTMFFCCSREEGEREKFMCRRADAKVICATKNFPRMREKEEAMEKRKKEKRGGNRISSSPLCTHICVGERRKIGKGEEFLYCVKLVISNSCKHVKWIVA